MENQRIHSSLSLPLGTILLLTAGGTALAAGGLLREPHLALGSFLPLALGLALWLSREPEFRGVFTPDGLHLEVPEVDIPYTEITSVSLRDMPQDPHTQKLKRGPIVIVHGDRITKIPQRLNVPVENVYEYLLKKTSDRGSKKVHSRLEPHLKDELDKFGQEHVWTFRGRNQLGFRSSGRRLRMVCGFLVATGILWIAAPFLPGFDHLRDDSFWLGLGVLLSVVSGFVLILSKMINLHPGRQIANRRQASLVIGPSGLAMVQGDVEGHLRWDELQDIKFVQDSKGFRISNNDPASTGLLLIVEGARIAIADIYDRPLPVIAAAIRRMWQGPA